MLAAVLAAKLAAIARRRGARFSSARRHRCSLWYYSPWRSTYVLLDERVARVVLLAAALYVVLYVVFDVVLGVVLASPRCSQCLAWSRSHRGT